MELTTRSLSYSANNKFLIRDLDLNFSSGRLYALLGPNGAGKSTLLKVLAGIWPAKWGRIFSREVDLLKLDRRNLSKLISLVPQNSAISFDFSAEDIVAMGLYSRRRHSSNAQYEIDGAFDRVKIAHLKKRAFSNLSQGEKKLTYIARSLVTGSPILLLDEPTSSLDINHQSRIWNLLKELSEQDKILIAATHDIEAAKTFCDESIVLNGGVCQAKGASPRLLSPENLTRFFKIPADY